MSDKLLFSLMESRVAGVKRREELLFGANYTYYVVVVLPRRFRFKGCSLQAGALRYQE